MNAQIALAGDPLLRVLGCVTLAVPFVSMAADGLSGVAVDPASSADGAGGAGGAAGAAGSGSGGSTTGPTPASTTEGSVGAVGAVVSLSVRWRWRLPPPPPSLVAGRFVPYPVLPPRPF